MPMYSSSVAIQDYPSWNRPDTFLAECSSTFTSIPLTSCAYAHLMYITSCIYSIGQKTQFSSAVVDALSTAISSSSSQANRRNSVLLGLPAELRNTVYEYLFQTSTVTLRHCPGNRHHRVRILRQPKSPTALLFTCRQIRHESSVLYYQMITFKLKVCCAENDLHRHAMTGSDNIIH